VALATHWIVPPIAQPHAQIIFVTPAIAENLTQFVAQAALLTTPA